MYIDTLFGLFIGFIIGFCAFSFSRFSVTKYNLKRRRGFYSPASYTNKRTDEEQSILDAGLNQNPDNDFK